MKRALLCAALIVACLGIRNCRAENPPGPVILYYRVVEMQTKQVRSTEIKELKGFLKQLGLTYVCGQSYHDNVRGGAWVPVAIQDSRWQSHLVRSEAQRKKIIARMSDLGIETSIDPPDLDDDCGETLESRHG